MKSVTCPDNWRAQTAGQTLILISLATWLPAQELPLRTIEQARNLTGKEETCRLQGVVTASTGTLLPRRFDFYLQDGAGGVLVAYDGPQPLEEGHRVQVTGRMTFEEAPRRQHRFLASGLAILPGPKQPAPPLRVSLDDLVAGRYQGQLVHISGSVLRVTLRQDNHAIYLAPETTVRFIVPTPIAGETIQRLLPGTRIKVTGIVVPRVPEGGVQHYQVRLRDLRDLEVLSPYSIIRTRDFLLAVAGVTLLIVAAACWIFALRRSVRRRTAALLRARQESQQVIDGVRDIVFQSDAEGRWTLLNPAWKRILGFETEASLGKPFHEFVHPEDREENLSRLRALLARENDYCRHEVRYLTAEGGFRWIEAHAQRIEESGGRVTGVRGTLRDITERKQMEEDLRQKNKEFETVFHSAPVFIFELDRDHRIVRANQSAAADLGLSEHDLIGKTLLDLIPGEDAGRIWEADELALATEQAKLGQTASVRLPNGQARWVRIDRTPLRDEQGAVKGLLVIVTDLTELRRAEASFEEASEFGRQVIEHVEQGFFVLGPDFRYRLWSPYMERIAGLGQEAVLGKHPLDLFPFLGEQGVFPLIEKAMAGGKVATPDYRYSTSAGRSGWARAAFFPLRNAAGEITGVMGTVHEISERKRAEEALRASEERLRLALRGSDEGIWDTNLETGEGYISAQWKEMLGYGEEDLPAAAWEGLLHPEDRERVLQILDDHLAGRTDHYACEYRMRSGDGSYKWILARGRAHRDESGKAVRILGSHTDITERKKFELEEKSRREVLETVFSHIPVMLALYDSSGQLLMANRAMETILGYAADDCRRGDFLLRCYPDPEERQRAIRHMLKGDAAWMDFRTCASDGRILETSWANVRLSDGSSIGIGQDITQRKNLEAQLRQGQKMEAIGRLAGGIAHDFNNLLTVINGYTGLALQKLEPRDPLYSNLTEIGKAGNRAAELTRQLLAFSRKQVLEAQVLDLNRTVEEMSSLIRRLLGEQVRLVVTLDPALPRVKVDPGQLQQVIMNLAVNARDAMPEGGVLTIETSPAELDDSFARVYAGITPGRYARLVVRDTGCGMDEATRLRLFEPFFTTKAPSEGTGIGLATVYGIVKQSGGEIEVESAPGAGARFTVWLPAAAEPSPNEMARATSGARGGRETILVVEDQAEVRRFVRQALAGYGYHVIEAAGGDQAIEILEAGSGSSVDLLLTDVVMPGMSGAELARRFRERSPAIRVLFMSGYAHVEGQDPFSDGGRAAFIQKPFTPDGLAQKVREVLSPHRGARTILVVDDEEGVRRWLRAVLERAGYQVEEAAGGTQAMQQLHSQPVDLVLIDVVMPEPEGMETIPAIRREHPGARIIAMSGAFGGQFLQTAALLGARATLTKPAAEAELLATIQRVLAS